MQDNKRSVTKKWKYGLAAAALAVSVITALPVWTVGLAQAAPDLETPCTLTIQRKSETKQGDITVDLYKVAEAVPVNGYDAYQLELLDAYSGFESKLDAAMGQGTQQPEGANALYRELAQDLAGAVLPKKAPPAGGTEQTLPTPDYSIEIPAAGNGKGTAQVLPGMYLVIAHGAGLSPERYTTSVKEEGTGAEKIATAAYSGGYIYTYLPELISLPMRSIGEGGTPTGSFGTDGKGEWLDILTVTLKSEEDTELAGLIIEKHFTNPDGAAIPGTEGCVYQIEATLDGETVYSNSKALMYKDAVNGTGTVVLEKIIPVGAQITVTEVYDGAAFDIEDGADRTITAVSDGDGINNRVSFTNKANGNGTGGDIVENSFTDGDAGWNWNNPKPGTVPQ